MIDVALFAQDPNNGALNSAERWLSTIGVPDDSDAAGRMASIVMDGLSAIGAGQHAYALKLAVVTKVLAALVVGAASGDKAESVSAVLCMELADKIKLEVRGLRKALLKDAKAATKTGGA